MEPHSQRRKRPNDVPLNEAIGALDLVKNMTTVEAAGDVLNSASVLLTTTRVGFVPLHAGRRLIDVSCVQDSMANEEEYVELALACADVCQTLHRGIGRSGDQLNQPTLRAIEQLET
jgi:hypothetical protein